MDQTPPSGAGNRDRALALADTYLDTVPRFASRPEAVGPFTLFVSTAPWPYYARPTPAWHGELSADDVAAVVARQRELDQPVAFEWVRETAPGAEAAIRASHQRCAPLYPHVVLLGWPPSRYEPGNSRWAAPVQSSGSLTCGVRVLLSHATASRGAITLLHDLERICQKTWLRRVFPDNRLLSVSGSAGPRR